MSVLTCDVCGRPIVEMGMGLYHEDGTLGCVGPDGIVHATRSPAPGEVVCDLCGETDNVGDAYIVTRPIATDIMDVDTLATLTLNQSEEWACCPTCVLDIGFRRFDAIVDRAVERLAAMTGGSSDRDEFARSGITDLHQTIWSGWDGKVRRGPIT